MLTRVSEDRQVHERGRFTPTTKKILWSWNNMKLWICYMRQRWKWAQQDVLIQSTGKAERHISIFTVETDSQLWDKATHTARGQQSCMCYRRTNTVEDEQENGHVLKQSHSLTSFCYALMLLITFRMLCTMCFDSLVWGRDKGPHSQTGCTAPLCASTMRTEVLRTISIFLN